MARKALLIFAAWAAVSLAAPPRGVSAQAPAKPSVVILTTGGTIASRVGAATLEGHVLVQAVPQLLQHAEVTVEEFSRIGSSLMTPAHWLGLSQRITTLFAERDDLAGVVVTHGTDTMEETAFFLTLTVHDARPVVLVGSMRPANGLSADGPANLLNAVRVAVAPQARAHGVLIVLNNEISSARDARKTDNQRVHTFRSPELGFLGYADPDTVIFYRTTTRPHTTASEFDVQELDELPRVAIVADYAGFDGSTIGEWAAKGVDGVVVTSFAGGRMSAGARQGVAQTAAGGFPVVVASRVPGGRIPGDPLNGRAILARDLPSHRARVLLMLALTVTRDVAAIQRMFDLY